MSGVCSFNYFLYVIMEFSVAIVKCQDGGLDYSEVIKPYVENGETMKLGLCNFYVCTAKDFVLVGVFLSTGTTCKIIKCKS